MLDLSICIVTMNHLDVLRPCLESINKNRPSKYSFEVIIVDNCSKDGTRTYLENCDFNFKMKYIENRRKYNYAKNNNIPMKNASGRYYLILNPDTIILPQTLDFMINYMEENPEVGASACKLLYGDMSFQENCRRFPILKYVIASRFKSWGINLFGKLADNYIQCSPNDIAPKPVNYIIGACMFLRKDAIKDIGGFDERFLLYFEDTDLCFRLWKNNWEIWYVPDVSIIHLYDRGASKSVINKKAILQVYTLILFYLKNYFNII